MISAHWTMSPRVLEPEVMDGEGEAAAYDEIDRIWGDVILQGFVESASMLGVNEGRVLDVGIGSGLNLPFYAGQAREIFGLDPSPRLLARAQRQTPHMEIPFRLLEG